MGIIDDIIKAINHGLSTGHTEAAKFSYASGKAISACAVKIIECGKSLFANTIALTGENRTLMFGGIVVTVLTSGLILTRISSVVRNCLPGILFGNNAKNTASSERVE